jgi:DNA (cytosine-5)-methyltransferase 1
MRFVDLFAGLGGFHLALKQQGHRCVFASEIDDELRNVYSLNFPDTKKRVVGDIREFRDEVPLHDILCAGFPCQPFSKSGSQLGLHDKIRGTLFDEIVYILERRRPPYVILENVGNFERHDKGRTWQTVKEKLMRLGYDVQGTEHITSGGSGLISPHHFGYPHSRERFFIVAKLGGFSDNPFPNVDRKRLTDLRDIIQHKQELSKQDREETRLRPQQIACIEHWNDFITSFPEDIPLPTFPIWGDEINATYPFEDYTPYAASIKELRMYLNGHLNGEVDRDAIMALLPSYARTNKNTFPTWKVEFIRQNREWFNQHKKYFPKKWIEKLREFPSSLRKLEWNCKDGERNIWKHVLQFRPSGLRVRRSTSAPSLVAMTSTQIPILGVEKRFLTQVEGLRLQGFPDTHNLPSSRDKAFKALGNAVHVGVVKALTKKLLSS